MIERRPLLFGGSEPAYDYGDGSLNHTKFGYNGKVYFGDEKIRARSTDNYHNGNFVVESFPAFPANPKIRISSVIQAISSTSVEHENVWWTKNRTDTEHRQCSFDLNDSDGSDEAMCLHFAFGAYAGYLTLQSLKFVIGDSEYTLQQMIDKGYIKPLVLYGVYSHSNGGSIASGTWIPPIIDGDGTTSRAVYGNIKVYFIKNKGTKISKFKFQSLYKSDFNPTTYKWTDSMNFYTYELPAFNLNLGKLT